MNTRRWGLVAVLVTALVFALSAGTVFGGVGGQGNGGGPPDQDEPVRADPVRGKPVKVNGKDMKLWVFVHPERGGKGKKPKPPDDDGPSPYCTDDNSQTRAVPKFADANPNGLTFNINDGSIPINKTEARQAIRNSFDAWDDVSPIGTYFAVNNTGGASRPVFDGNNSVGWVKIVPRSVLAAAWVWTDADDNVVQADVFFNAFHKWGVLSGCDEPGKYDVGNVGTHEFGHVVGLDHLADSGAFATMYPSASKGEIRKRSLTAGDAAGYTDAGGY